VVVAGLIGTAVVVGIWLVLTQTPIFGARAVTVVGASHETDAQVVAAAGLANHPPLFKLNTASAVRGVEQLPWVRSASVSVHWPDGVKIVVQEEVPRLVMAESGNQYAEISTDGRVLATSATRPVGLLAFGGPALPSAVGSSLGAKDAIGLSVASTLPASFSGQVTGVTVEPGGWVQLALTTPVVVDIGSDTQLQAKYEDVSAILAGATLHDGDIIDVSVPDAPTVTGP
jgi:cell division septal protein FtsQ